MTSTREFNAEVRAEEENGCGTCDGNGVIFTQSMEQAGWADADNVERCDECRKFEGDLEAARALALRLLLDTPEDDLDDNRKAWTHIVSAWDRAGYLHGGTDAIALRWEMPEAALYGHEHAPEGGHFRTESIGAQVPERVPPEPCFGCGEPVVTSPNGSEVERGGRLFCHEDCLDQWTDAAVESAARERDAEHPEADLLASGLFIALVDVGVQYVQWCQRSASPSSSIDGAIDCALAGLSENLSERLGGS